MNGTATRRAATPAVSEWWPDAVVETWPPAEPAHAARARSASARGGLARQAAYAAMDFALVCVGGACAFWVRFGFANPFGAATLSVHEFSRQMTARAYPGFLLLYAAMMVLACISQDLYRTAREQSALEESTKVAKAVGLATSLLVLFIFTSGNKEISRMVVAGAGALNVATLAGWRYAKRRYVLRRARRGVGVSRVLIVGAGKMGRNFASWLSENNQSGILCLRFFGRACERRSAGAGVVSGIAKRGAGAVRGSVVHYFTGRP